MSVRPASEDDVARIGQIAESTGLFPASFAPAMFAPSRSGARDVWRVAEDDAGVAGFAFARPEEMTDRTWNILALAVDPGRLRAGHASALMDAMDSALDARLIVVETTQLADQAAARALYLARGFEQQGHVRDFFGEGEDKIIFRKACA